ncbi:MAG: alpha/beta fold hydrolase [Candidatus Palauibacterales bacterium]|nr:alpha/beta fold hydrolase [Candidatus Palauibacterales bacterium]
METDDGVRLRYVVEGTGRDTLLVLHGGPGAGLETVRDAVAPLARDRVLLLYDQRGGGRSTLPEDTTLLSADAFVRDLETIRRRFELKRMRVFTHSFGSVLLARYAERHPDRLARIVLHGATGPRRQQAAELARAEASGAESAAGDTTLVRRHRELMMSLLRGETENVVQRCEEFESVGRKLARSRGDSVTWPGSTCDASPEAVRYYYRYTARIGPRSFGNWDFTDRLSDVSAPVLVIWGTRDSAALPAQRAWVRAFPNGRLLLVPGTGKGALAERPDRVRAAVDSFLRGMWPGNAAGH